MLHEEEEEEEKFLKMNTTGRKRIVVTGVKDINCVGYALCKLLITVENCFVYMGSKNIEDG
jgi:hypothetical protein